MATKPTKKPLVVGERTIASDLKPRDADAANWGPEPIFATQPDSDKQNLARVVAFNWYNRFYSHKDAKLFLVDYANQTGHPEAKMLSRCDEREVFLTLGWLARTYLRGLNLSEPETTALHSEISRLAKSVSGPKLAAKSSTAPAEKEEVPVAARPNVQEIMRERTREVAGEIEGWLDDFITNGIKANAISVNSVGLMTERNIMPQHVSIITEIWKVKLSEFEAVLDGGDDQLSEAYNHLTKTQLKALIKFCEAVLASLQSYLAVKKASKAPRKKKAVAPEKVVAKLKYLKEFAEFKLTSVAPKTLLNTTEIWLYDTAKRKLHYYIADSHIGTMSVKGTTIIGFDPTKSGIKTLRKPADVLKKLMAGGKPASRKVFTDVNAVQAQPNGRTNDAMIILKAY